MNKKPARPFTCVLSYIPFQPAFLCPSSGKRRVAERGGSSSEEALALYRATCCWRHLLSSAYCLIIISSNVIVILVRAGAIPRLCLDATDPHGRSSRWARDRNDGRLSLHPETHRVLRRRCRRRRKSSQEGRQKVGNPGRADRHPLRALRPRPTEGAGQRDGRVPDQSLVGVSISTELAESVEFIRGKLVVAIAYAC